MRTYFDCLPCLMDQALRAARLASDDEEKVKQVLDEVGLIIRNTPMNRTPPETAMAVYRKIREITGSPDPYRELKNQSTRIALGLYPALKTRINKSNDRVLAAIKIAIAGNVIDFGVNHISDIDNKIAGILEDDLAVCDYNRFREQLDITNEILYIGDNAGESVFDRILIEELEKPVTYVVRSAPVINDVTEVDAVQAGLDTVATLMASGTDAPGTVVRICSPEFREKFYRSKFTISKGQGNFEALSDTSVPVFFLLIAKCPIVARDIGVHVGDMILKGPPA